MSAGLFGGSDVKIRLPVGVLGLQLVNNLLNGTTGLESLSTREDLDVPFDWLDFVAWERSLQELGDGNGRCGVLGELVEGLDRSLVNAIWSWFNNWETHDKSQSGTKGEYDC